MNKAIIFGICILGLLLLGGCNPHSAVEDTEACMKEGLAYYSSSGTNIVKCIDEKTGIIYHFYYEYLDYCDECCEYD